jgi:hypothetical protein
MITLVYTALAALLIGLNVADWRLTRAIILSRKGYEANPVMAWLIARFGLDPALIGKVMLVVAIAAYLVIVITPALPNLALISLIGLDALYAWVVWHNWRVLR